MARFSHGSLGAHGLGAPCAECGASSTLTTGSWGSPNSWGGLGDTSMVPPRLIQQWVSQDVARPHAHGAPWLQRDQGTARNLASEPWEGREREMGQPHPLGRGASSSWCSWIIAEGRQHCSSCPGSPSREAHSAGKQHWEHPGHGVPAPNTSVGGSGSKGEPGPTGDPQAERSSSRPQPPPAHGDAVSHHGAGADGNAPLPALLPASLQQLPEPPGSPSAARALLQPCLAAPESQGPDSNPQTQHGCSVPKPRTNHPGCTF